MNVLVAPNNTNGCFYHRLFLPHIFLSGAKCDIAVIDVNTTVEDLNNYDIVVTHNPVKEVVDLVKSSKSKLVVDCDDYWYLGKNHPFEKYWLTIRMPEKIKYGITNADLVTTTTEELADRIREFNKNVVILPNALTYKIPQFQINKQPHNKIRFGIIGGCSHLNDIRPVGDAIKYLKKKYLDKCQFVLAGFYDNDIWKQMECIITDNYRICSDEYKRYLLRYTQEPYEGNFEDEPYIRIWSQDVTEYAYVYDNIDVLLAPLLDDRFIRCKSELKIVEAGYKNVAVIAGNVPQYSKLTDKVCSNYMDYLKYIEHYIDNQEDIKKDADLLTEKITKNYKLEDVNVCRLSSYEKIL